MMPGTDMHFLLVRLVASLDTPVTCFVFTKYLAFDFFFLKTNHDYTLSYLHEQDNGGIKCECPAGFKGDGVKDCTGEIV